MGSLAQSIPPFLPPFAPLALSLSFLPFASWHGPNECHCLQRVHTKPARNKSKDKPWPFFHLFPCHPPPHPQSGSRRLRTLFMISLPHIVIFAHKFAWNSLWLRGAPLGTNILRVKALVEGIKPQLLSAATSSLCAGSHRFHKNISGRGTSLGTLCHSQGPGDLQVGKASARCPGDPIH